MTKSTQILSEHAKAEIDFWIKKYPKDQKQSAVLAALLEVQHENQGYLTTELLDAVADYLEMPPIAVYEVASFYSMLETEKCGRHSISVDLFITLNYLPRAIVCQKVKPTQLWNTPKASLEFI